MYSKLVTSDVLIKEALERGNIDKFKHRASGDTLGKALSFIGTLMMRGTEYISSVSGTESNYSRDELLYREVKRAVDMLGLKHFEFNDNKLTVKYDIWRDI